MGIWNVQDGQASWVVQKILKAVKHLQEASFTEANMESMEKYNVSRVYLQIRGRMEKVGWRSLAWKNVGSPKWLFILYLAVMGRLATKDRLAKWGIVQIQTCHLCQQENEDHDHLFFKCSYAAEVWTSILKWKGINKNTKNWMEEIQWASKCMKGQNGKTMVYRMALENTVYCIWLECNARIFQQKKTTSSILVKHIIQEIHGRGSRYAKVATRLDDLNNYP
ncbi:uncharacterized protein LOC125828845 [Solanum verrucosum]|uniref:uncharacterized protein LOC125828845 n=1 Tax=Solanum verrucosum TaxID=315347 RepID=UPI0020CFFE11|nr:uncharacterized protein LOC125828845 [Solanum verrucosum]